MNIRILQENPRSPDVAEMLQQSDKYYDELYPSESNHLLDIDTLSQPNVAFFTARIDNVLRGFGAIVNQESYAEVKRMYVDPDARGMSLGKKLLSRLEAHALLDGNGVIRLETGIRQPEAIGLYNSFGYREVEPHNKSKRCSHNPLRYYVWQRIY